MHEQDDKISIYLVDDQAMIRAAFRALLERTGRFDIVGDCGDAREGIREVERLAPDIVVLDITMPGLSGLDAIAPIKRCSPRTKVVMASQHVGLSFVRESLEAGADAYISKDAEPVELGLAIESVFRGDSYLSADVAGVLMHPARGVDGPVPSGSQLESLTRREREVFQLIAIGKTNKEIAAELHLSVGTVKKHRENMQRKLDCHSAAEIARLAIREGLLSI